ncbi:beta-lactamase family protein [Bacillus shivajii]|uniref:serine hydrolase domain-containing protein n=1 Tax=Bacillus shivajii TaxID=1983719 RepID=UPI001CFC39EE|nr:serine hydrolase [Bacillus shivajii]UCZ54141.1 beta-lactamase family protein [Bacillus shivajii]
MMEQKSWVEHFEPFADKIINKYEVPGTAIAVSKNGDEVYKRGIGYRNIDKKLEVTDETMFGIASITKSFTAMAIMQLQEAGMLSVEDPVVTYLPEFKTPNPQYTEKITIHHFLTHTSGLPTLPSLYYAMKRTMENDPSVSEKQKERLKEEEPIDNYDELLTFIGELEIELLGEPGTQFCYSNDAYALLGAIVERVSGKPFAEYVTDQILKPTGMTSSTFDINSVLHNENVTSIYAAKEEEGEKEVYLADKWWDSPAMLGAGFLRSNVKDMLRYTKIYVNNGTVNGNRILTPESLQEMTHPHVQFQQNKYYGYGLMITPNYNGGTLIEHGGSLKGISSHMSIVPEKGLAGMILTNLVGIPVSPLLLGALNAVQGLAPETPLMTYEDYTVQVDELDQYVGKFISGEGAEMTVSKEDSTLFFENEGKKYEMRPVDKHLFTIDMNESETPIRFLINEQEDVYGLFLGVRQILKEEADEKSKV